MTSSRKLLSVLLLTFALLLAGCSGDDNPNRPAGSDPLTTAVVRGELEGGTFAYEFASETPGGAHDPAPGAFMVRIDSLKYDADSGQLTFDMWAFNASPHSYPNPVSLTFMQLMPEAVAALNADNGESGAGARFDFEFANDDLEWTPRESSLRRKVQFRVPAGSSVGFVAKVDVGTDEPAAGGAIGGLVWRDENSDGLLDPVESGAEGVVLVLHAGSAPEADSPLLRAVTDADGRYRFDALDEGHYTVEVMPAPGLVPTTEPRTHVLLVSYDGEIADYLDADFGVSFRDVADTVAVGDCFNAKGLFATDPDRLAAEIFNYCDCDGDSDEDCDRVDDEDKSEDDCWGRLSGPITDLDRENGAIAVMGTWIYFPNDGDLSFGQAGEDEPDLIIGTRVRVDAALEHGPDGSSRVIGCRVHHWRGNGDRVRGIVQEVLTNDQGKVTGVKVLNTVVSYPLKPRD